MMKAIVTIPPYASYLQDIADHPVVEGLRLNTVMPIKESLEDMLTRLKGVAKGKPIQSPNALFTLAGWLRDKQDFKQAFNCYSALVKSHKGHDRAPEAYYELAKLLYKQGKNTAKFILRPQIIP